MAGLGEVCTHVAAVLFFLETKVRINGTSTCTQQKCQWVVPTFQKSIPYLPVKEIDFTSAKVKKRKIDDAANSSACASASPSSSLNVQSPVVKPPDANELKSLFKALGECDSKPAVLSLIPEYANRYIPKSRLSNFPKPLQSLFDPRYLAMDYNDLVSACESISICVTEEMMLAVEEATRNQSSTRLWYVYRAGRVTASRMKQVCHTNASLPSQSLVKNICYPEAYRFITKATQWGCTHEAVAKEHYIKVNRESHADMSVVECGLVINPEWPHLGASPDGIVQCTCCGKGVLEIKCPYCKHDQHIEVNAASCLSKAADGSVQLDRSHAYYYQVQTQIFICKVEYCDFCVCTFPETGPSLYTERIYPDSDFWHTCIDKATHFFRICILPEILGKWYTRPFSVPLQTNSKTGGLSEQCSPCTSTSDGGLNKKLYCYCKQPEDGVAEMIACDNPQCLIEWFHTDCLKIKHIPKGKWYCPDCRKLPQFNVVRKGKRATIV